LNELEWKNRIIRPEDLIDDEVADRSKLLWPMRETFKHDDVSSNAAMFQGLDEEFEL